MNERLRTLLGRKQEVLTKMRALSGIADAEKRDLTAAEAAEFKPLREELRAIEADISDEHMQIRRQRTAPAISGARRDMYAGGGDHTDYLGEEQPAVTGRRYAQMFAGRGLDDGGFRSGAEFFAVLKSGHHDPRLTINAAASGGAEGVGVDGGYVVPEQFVAELLDDSLEDEIVRPRASVRPMTSNSLWVAGFDLLNHATSIGGFDAKWAAEGGQFNFQKAKLRGIQLKASKLGILTAGTNELLADSSFYRQELPDLMVKAIGFGLDIALLSGDGNGQPRGVLKDPALITVLKEAGQAVDTITWNNVKAMFARLHPRSHKNAVWVVSHTAKVQLLSLVQFIKNVAGTENVGGSWIPVMREEDGKFYILGLEVIFTEKLPVLGDLGDILLVDFSQYVVGMRGEMTIATSAHFKFDFDETAFRGILRVDGQGRWNAPMLPRNGSANDSLSWCITLEAR